MPLMVGGGDRRADRNGMSFFFLLSAVLLLSVGVAAVPEENPPVQEQPPQEKAASPHPLGPAVSEDVPKEGNTGFIHAFVASFSVIIVSELGDKTFFIAAIMAMRYNRLTVLTGAMLALGVMTCLSVLFGYATTVIPRIYTYYVSTALFAIFGIRMLREGLRMSADEGQEELEEVQAEIKKKDEELQRSKLVNGAPDVEAGLRGRHASGKVAQLHLPHFPAGPHPHLPGRVGGPLAADHHYSSCAGESIWSCSGWYNWTLFVYRTGCDRRENDRPENICQDSYNHRRDCFSGVRPVGPVHQARRWIVIGQDFQEQSFEETET
uniref:GDT1 family protein n=1 Tax=Sander lucioperca TaxID=283035 RepID=A0A8D0D141_SANLU